MDGEPSATRLAFMRWRESQSAPPKQPIRRMGKCTMDRHRARLCREQDNRCYWCGINMTPTPISGKPPWDSITVDHLVPLSKGGDNSRENMVAACHSCNQRRNRAEMKGKPLDWRPLLAVQHQQQGSSVVEQAVHIRPVIGSNPIPAPISLEGIMAVRLYRTINKDNIDNVKPGDREYTDHMNDKLKAAGADMATATHSIEGPNKYGHYVWVGEAQHPTKLG